MSTPAILVDNVSKRYRIGKRRENQLRDALVGALKRAVRREPAEDETIWALRDVSFEVREGEVVGIVGRNGAGKSTLLKILSRITYPTSGRIRIRGRVGSLLEVGTGFHEELTGRENVYLNGSILGMKKREITAKLDDIVEFADVRKFIDTPIKHYSSGMRLRLGFSVAAHLDTDILFVDEVLAVGDIGFQKKCISAMGDLQSRGRTVLFVSHNMAAVENLCPRSLWIENGRIREDGRSGDIIRSYMSTFAGARENGFDLTQFTSRQGSGEIRYTGIEFLGEGGEPKRLTCSGDRLVVRLHYQVHRQVVKPVFGLRIGTNTGTMVTDTSTWNTGVEIPRLSPGNGYMDLAIDFLNLMPGRYFLSLWLTSQGKIVYDRLENCASLDVETSNYYQSGRGIASHLGIIFLPCRWDVAGLHECAPSSPG